MSTKKKILLIALVITVALIAFFFPKKSNYSKTGISMGKLPPGGDDIIRCGCLGYQPVVYDAPPTCYGLTYSCKCSHLIYTNEGTVDESKCASK